jgi:F-box protein 11
MQYTKFGAFWSYVHSDDQHERGRISRLRARLEQSIHFYLGKSSFKIFQDKDEIGWGQKWQERIENSLSEALLLFPIVTPSYFTSKACQNELAAFEERQAKLGRNDLILPIYYLTADLLEGGETDGEKIEKEVAQRLKTHQYEDFRSLRASEETDPSYFQAIKRLGFRAAEALKRTRPSAASPSDPASSPKSPASTEGDKNGGSDTEVSRTNGALPGHVLSLTVNQMPGRGDVTSIAEAIARAPGGARIFVSPGHYREAIVIEKPLELIGNGNVEDVVIESNKGDTIIFDTNIGLVRNLTIRQTKKYDKAFKGARDNAVWIKQGRLELEDCHVTSTDGSCIHVGNEADPRVRRNRVHDSRGSGILVLGRARGTYEDNEIFRSTFSGIAVGLNANSTFRRNRSYENSQSGLFVYGRSQCVFEDNEFYDNKWNGVSVKDAAKPIVRRCRLHANGNSGLRVYENGQGTYEDNDISRNGHAGIVVEDTGMPVVRRNTISLNSYEAIWIKPGGSGVFSDNDLTGNGLGAWDVPADSKGKISDERNIVTTGEN